MGRFVSREAANEGDNLNFVQTFIPTIEGIYRTFILLFQLAHVKTVMFTLTVTLSILKQ